jgi:hypothetical protein
MMVFMAPYLGNVTWLRSGRLFFKAYLKRKNRQTSGQWPPQPFSPLARITSLLEEATLGEKHHPFALSWNVSFFNVVAQLDESFFAMSWTLKPKGISLLKIEKQTLLKQSSKCLLSATHRANEEIFVNHAHNSEVCVHEDFIHNPHDVGQHFLFGVEGCHEQRHIGCRLMVD